MSEKTRIPKFMFYILGVLAMAVLYLIVSNLMLRSMIFKAPVHAVDESPEFHEIWSCGPAEGTKVVRISLDGVIMRSTPSLLGSSPDKVGAIISQVQAAKQDEAVKAIVLEINSPGGGVTASDEIYHALMQFKASQDGRKVVVLCRDLMASGGYYVAMAADHIVAEPTSIIGSIGVLIQSYNVSDLVKQIGVSDVSVVSTNSTNKLLLNPFRGVEPAHEDILQHMVDSMYNRFAGLVRDARGLDQATMTEYADGRIFPSDDAKEHGFIDEIGYWDETLAATGKLLGQDNLHVVRYAMPRSLMESLLGVEASDLSVNMPTWAENRGPQLMYLLR